MKGFRPGDRLIARLQMGWLVLGERLCHLGIVLLLYPHLMMMVAGQQGTWMQEVVLRQNRGRWMRLCVNGLRVRECLL